MALRVRLGPCIAAFWPGGKLSYNDGAQCATTGKACRRNPCEADTAVKVTSNVKSYKKADIIMAVSVPRKADRSGGISNREPVCDIGQAGCFTGSS